MSRSSSITTPDFGTFTSTSDYNLTKEIDTGDAYDFRPDQGFHRLQLLLCRHPGGRWAARAGESQSQFIDEKTVSQELRFTSNKIGGFSWIAGAYYVHTERFISTDNLFDRGDGVPRRLSRRRSSIRPIPFATNTNATFLADSQNNNAWAVFGDATYEFNRSGSSMRRSATTRISARTPPIRRLASCPIRRMLIPARCASVTFDAAQPKGTLRYKPTDDLTLYGGWSRGFRSGGFNQTGVGAVAAASGHLGVHDLFQAEIADTWEVGAKSQLLDRRVEREPGALLHQLAQRLLLLLRLDHLDAEPRQSRRHCTRAPSSS